MNYPIDIILSGRLVELNAESGGSGTRYGINYERPMFFDLCCMCVT